MAYTTTDGELMISRGEVISLLNDAGWELSNSKEKFIISYLLEGHIGVRLSTLADRLHSLELGLKSFGEQAYLWQKDNTSPRLSDLDAALHSVDRVPTPEWYSPGLQRQQMPAATDEGETYRCGREDGRAKERDLVGDGYDQGFTAAKRLMDGEYQRGYADCKQAMMSVLTRHGED